VTGPGRATFSERLWPPTWLWLVVSAFVVVVAVAVGAPLGVPAGLLAAAVLEGLSAWVLLRAAAAVEVVPGSDGHLRAGRARLPLGFVGAVTPLDPDAAGVLRGTGADARAFLLIRSWAPAAVRVDVADPADPTPYWYVSTRDPEGLADALAAAAAPRHDEPPPDRAG